MFFSPEAIHFTLLSILSVALVLTIRNIMVGISVSLFCKTATNMKQKSMLKPRFDEKRLFEGGNASSEKYETIYEIWMFWDQCSCVQQRKTLPNGLILINHWILSLLFENYISWRQCLERDGFSFLDLFNLNTLILCPVVAPWIFYFELKSRFRILKYHNLTIWIYENLWNYPKEEGRND